MNNFENELENNTITAADIAVILIMAFGFGSAIALFFIGGA